MTAVGLPVVVEVVRSGFVEARHRGSLIALAADGSVDWAVGAPEAPVLPRSTNKPLQALGMVELGLDLPPDLLALACASHSGEGFHLDGLRRILAGAGLEEDALRCPADWPLDDQARDAAAKAGLGRTRLAMNCSGKHAAMLATCVVNGWSIEDYLSADHPLQRGIRATVERVAGEEAAAVAVDGCGAPLLGLSLAGLARAFRLLVLAQSGAEHLVADAIRTHPAYVSGTRRDELALLTALPGAIGKAGAEGCYAVALPDGRSWALKIDDGAARARPAVMAAALVRSGVDGEAIRRTGVVEVLGGGVPVGQVRAAV